MTHPSTNPSTHQMELETTYPSGVQEWVCPTCTRRFILQPPPKFRIIVLNAGNDQASHTGSTRGLKISPPEMNDSMPEDLRSALEEALKDVDFSDWSDEDD